MIDQSLCLKWLADWAKFSEQWWYDIPGSTQWGCYGSGYNAWGVQTNQKYLAAMAVLGTHADAPDDFDRSRALERALKALRFSLASHLCGPARRTDGTSWGHTWISGLGIERMMHAVQLLRPHLTGDDRLALYRMLTSEADWIWQDYHRGRHRGVFGDRWDASGKNAPESNLWSGALLWRTAVMYPDHPNAESWRECAHRYLINSISVRSDADDERIVAGKAVKEWFEGENFFDNLALDHHGYLNTGYMAICMSNAAMLHFDLKAGGFERPESLDHHQQELWQTIRRLLFQNGRIARIGGEKRVRYGYCQEYLLPSLMYAADRFGEPHAAALAGGMLEMIQREREWSGDGGFFSRRLKRLQVENPYYYTRLESDRACALGQLITYAGLVEDGTQSGGGEEFEAGVAGGWHEPEHGALMHRCPTRLASMSWRAYSQTQALCQPPGESHLTDWSQNLTGTVGFVGRSPLSTADQRPHRRLTDCHTQPLEGGFVTWGRIEEGCNLKIDEGWSTDAGLADHRIAIAALPDGHTLVGLQQVRIRDRRALVREIKGLHLNLVNDFYNNGRRILTTAAGDMTLNAPAPRDEVIDLHSPWLNIEGRLGVVGLYGAQTLHLHRCAEPRAGSEPMLCSLNVEEINWHCEVGMRAADPGEVLLDVGWAVLSGASIDQTSRWAELHNDASEGAYGRRSVTVQGLDGNRYLFAADFREEPAPPRNAESPRPDTATGDAAGASLPPGRARLQKLDGPHIS